MEQNHTQVTQAVTRARCAEGMSEYMDLHLSLSLSGFLNMSVLTCTHTHGQSKRKNLKNVSSGV